MYFCRNCGEAYQTDEAVLCVKCGAGKGQGANFCHSCGKPMNPEQTVCKMAAGLLGIFLGSFGVHNFYLGYTSKAVIQLVCTIVGILLSCVGIGVFVVMGISIWGLVEGIMLLCGKIDVDGEGNPLAD